MSGRPAALLILLCSCAEPKLEVSFRVPAPYRAEVTTASLEIFHPPAAQPYSCDDLAFGAVDADTLAQTRAQRFDLEAKEELELEGIDRRATKVVVARAYDRNGDPVAAGCRDLGEIDETRTLRIHAEPVTLMTVTDTEEPAAVPWNEDLPDQVTVALKDVLHAPLPATTVRWAVVGAGGVLNTGEGPTDASGRYVFAPPLLTHVGPAALHIFARWQHHPVPVIGGFKWGRGWYTESPETGQILDFEVGRIGPDGQMGLVLVLRLETAPDVYELVQTALYYDPHAPGDIDGWESPPLAEVPALGLVSGPDRDRVLLVTATQWYEIDPETGGLQARAYLPPAGTPQPLAVEEVSDCSAPGTAVLVSYAGVAPRVYTPEGQRRSENELEQIGEPVLVASSACVPDQTTSLHRTLVYWRDADVSTLMFPPTHVAIARDGLRVAAWPGDLFRFAVAEGTSPGAQQVLAVEAMHDQFMAGRFELSFVGTDDFGLELVAADPLPGFCLGLDAGDIDGDDRSDLVALLGIPSSSMHLAYVAMASEYRSVRLASTVITDLDWENPRVRIADFDANGIDDLILVDWNHVAEHPEDPQAERFVNFQVWLMGDI